MKKDRDENDYTVDEGKEEETHCIKCGYYLGKYGHGSHGTIPCPKCKEPNELDYRGQEYVVKRKRIAVST